MRTKLFIGIVFALTILSSATFVQTPQKFKYQAVARDANGNPDTNALIGVRVTILNGASPVYTETHTATTNQFGLFNLEIGGGAGFTAINWSTGNKNICLDFDFSGGTNYTLLGDTVPLLSVPYALYSETAGISLTDFDTDSTNELQTISKAGNTISLSNGGGSVTDNDSQTLAISGNALSVSNGNTITLPVVNGIIIVDNSNYSTVSVTNNSYVEINGTVNISNNYSGLNYTGLHISGGKFSGTGSPTITFGNYSAITNTNFQNVGIDNASGYYLTFINCYFNGTLPALGTGSSCAFINCTFSGVTVTNTNTIGYIYSSNISSNCNFPSVTGIYNSVIGSSIIGSSTTGANKVQDNSVSSSKIYLNSDASFSNNICSYTNVQVLGNNVYTLMVSGNKFQDLYTGASEVITIDPANSSNYKLFKIVGNNFSVQSSDPRSIGVISNDNNGFNQTFLTITDNTFNRGTVTLYYSSNLRVHYAQNVSYNTSHPASTGNLTVTGNYTY